MVDIASRLPHNLCDEIISFIGDYQALNWKYAVALNAEKALIIAAKCGNVHIVRKSIDWYLSWKSYSAAVVVAANCGHSECVRLLCPLSGRMSNSIALSAAARSGYTECVRLLIPVSEPMYCNSVSLRMAAKNGHYGCLKLLIPVSDLSAYDDEALYMATENGHKNCRALLNYHQNKLCKPFFFIFVTLWVVLHFRAI